MVGVGQGVKGLLQVPVGHAVRPVFVGLAAFVLDHVTLHVKPLLVESVQQKPHPVGFQPQGQFQVVGRHVFPVVGAVRSGGAVEVGARLLERFEVAPVMVFRALEHHVFEEVGEPGPAHLFVLGAHVVPDVHRHQGDGVVFMEDDVHAVGEPVFFESDAYHSSSPFFSI